MVASTQNMVSFVTQGHIIRWQRSSKTYKNWPYLIHSSVKTSHALRLLELTTPTNKLKMLYSYGMILWTSAIKAITNSDAYTCIYKTYASGLG